MGNPESLTKTIAKGGAFFTAGNLIEKIVALVSGLLVIGLLSVYDYGLWRLILAAFSICLILTFPTISQITIADSSVEYGRRDFRKYKALLKQYAYFTIGISLLLWLIIFFSAPLISKITGKDLTLFFQIISFYVLANGALNIYHTFFYSELRFKIIVALKIFSKISYLVLILIFLWFLKIGLLGVILAYTLSPIIVAGVFFPLFVKRASYLRKIEEGDGKVFWRGLKRHGKWGMATDYLADLTSNSRPWIIGYFLGVNSVAVFSVAQSFYGAIASALPLDKVLKPTIPRTIFDRERFNRLFQKSIKYSFWIHSCLFIAALIFVPPFVKIVFPKYLSSLPLFYILIFALFPLGSGVSLKGVFYSLKAQKGLFISTFARVFSVWIILPILILFLGLKGAALEFVFLSFLLVSVRYFIIKKIKPDLSINLRGLFKFDQYDKILITKIINRIKR